MKQVIIVFFSVTSLIFFGCSTKEKNNDLAVKNEVIGACCLKQKCQNVRTRTGLSKATYEKNCIQK